MRGLRLAQSRIEELIKAQNELWKKAGKEKKEYKTYEIKPVAIKTIFVSCNLTCKTYFYLFLMVKYIYYKKFYKLAVVQANG